MIRSLQNFALTVALAALSIAGAAPAAAQIVFDDFDDGDVSDIGVFSGSGGGVGVGPTDDRNGTEASALSVGINPADIGGFAGFVVPGADGMGSADVSAATYLTFYIRPTTVQAGNQPLQIDINLHEDVNGDGAYDGATEDEFQAVYRLEPGAGYTFVQIPLASFGDDNAVFPGANDGFDFTRLFEIVFAVGEIPGPEFALAIDDIGFAAGMPVSNEEDEITSPSGFSLSAAYPNPFQTEATFTLELDRAEAVRVEVFDVLGRQVAVLNDGVLSAQAHTFRIDARGLSSGLYLYRATGESFSATRRVVLQD